MRFSGQFTYVDFDEKGYRKSYDEAMDTQMRQAARAWLRALLTARLPIIRRGHGDSIGIPPVWTGTARGTLLPLGRFLKVAIPIRPIAKRTGKGPEVGAAMGKYFFGKNKGRYYFRFSTQLAYFTANEFHQSNLNLTHKTPWNGLKAGQVAFKAYVENVMPGKLPKIADSIRYKTRIVS